MADITARGVRFHVQRLGAPPGTARGTVVFLHGLVMDNLSSFYFTLASPVAELASVVLYDLRGHGMSERPPGGYTLDDMVADLDALLATVAPGEPIFLAGNSFGGLLALAFAARYPERTRGLALFDAHVGEAGWAEKMAATLALDGEERDRQIAISFEHWAGRHSTRKSTRLAQTASALVHGTSLVADMRASGSLADDEIRRVRAPVLALYGETSDLRAQAERLAALLPACDLRIVPGASHSILWEATARVRADLLAWLATQIAT